MIPQNVESHPVVADEVKEWKDFNEEEKAHSCRTMEVLARMVECTDANVGKVLDYLEETMIWTTLSLFSFPTMAQREQRTRPIPLSKAL